VTFKDLKKRFTLEMTQQSKILERLRNKPFWICDIEKHKQGDIKTNGDCCFNHIVGLPTKVKVEKPMFDYEKLLYDSLLLLPNYGYSNNIPSHNFKDKHLSIKKATRLGVTEFFLRLMACCF
jgi:hypothetical protein